MSAADTPQANSGPANIRRQRLEGADDTPPRGSLGLLPTGASEHFGVLGFTSRLRFCAVTPVRAEATLSRKSRVGVILDTRVPSAAAAGGRLRGWRIREGEQTHHPKKY